MAEAVVSSVLGKLADILINKAQELKDVRGQIEQMQEDLRLIHALLRDANSKRNTSRLVTEWLNQVKEIGDRINSVIDTFRVNIEQTRPESSNWVKRKMTDVKRNYETYKHGLRKELEGITQQLNRILQRGIQFGIQDKLGALDDDVDDLDPSDKVDDPEVVGLEDDKAKIIKQLLDSSISRRTVLSIVGTGGLGKTTLAKKVYKSAELEGHFHCRAWLSISQKYILNDLRREFLYSIEPQMKDKKPPVPDGDLVLKLKSSLRCKRYLIILDDVWDIHLWEQFEEALPDQNNESRVIITTRKEDVAQVADCNTDIHKIDYLNNTEGLALLFRRALKQHIQPGDYPGDLLQVAKRLTKKCGGLPLALVVLGGILTRRPRTYFAWSKVEDTMDWSDEDGEKCMKILARSYEDLPDHLKSCFLYFAAFPEDYEISGRHLTGMWMAEEFILKGRRGTMEDRAEKCLEELVQRCLIQVTKKSWNGYCKYCSMHDLLRDLAIREAKEKNFFTVFSKAEEDVNQLAARKPCRAALQFCTLTEDGVYSENTRSLLCFGVGEYSPEVCGFSKLNYSGFSQLRVLTLEKVNMTKFTPRQWPKGLKHLTYLGLRNCPIPQDIFKKFSFYNLETIDFENSIAISADPGTTIKCDVVIPTLRHVYGSRHFDLPLKWDQHTNLQTVKNVSIKKEFIADLGCCINLRTLGICRDMDPWGPRQNLKEGLNKEWQNLKDVLRSSEQLVYLSLKRLFGGDQLLPFGGTKDLPCHGKIQKLHLDGEWDRNICVPSFEMFPTNLTKLTLVESGLHEDPMPILERLQSLSILNLTYESYVGIEMICSTGGFPKLKKLKLFLLNNLRHWDIKEGAMPILTHLEISHCKMLHTFPGLEKVWTLQELFVRWSSLELCESIQGKDRQKFEHIPSVRIICDVKVWVKKIKSPDAMLHLNSLQPDLVQPGEEKELHNQHERCLLVQEFYWHQRSRLKWALYGDNNTKFFHASAVTRKRRNTICALLNEQGNWVTDEKLIRNIFISHFRGIYSKGSRESIEAVYSAELLAGLPKIPEAAHHLLEATPTEGEIKKALMALGANKSPGPDGFNAQTIQENWGCFGPAVLAEVQGFFSSGRMSSSVARSNLILIPKIDDPTEVSHFRPISVCNVVYKVISKVICSRLKPFIGSCISHAQSAFVPGRDISDNVILLREVLHSFRSRNFSRKGFCLKADLSKAFDRMDWDYLESIMPFYGFPPKLILWIMGCVRSAEFSVVLNGVGDGFFKPECGLRQGCALSPYLFILGMDLLCRSLENLAGSGWLRGLKLAPQAAVLTSCVYADDLLLFGEVTGGEAELIKQMLINFSSVSGQQIGPQKSSIWFSRCTSEEVKLLITQIFEVSVSNVGGKYLGAPVVSSKEAYDFLIEKVASRLKTWKGRMLSHAGRVVLIKSVLQALPIYFMSTDKIPESVIKQITGLMRRFFWGAMDKDKFLSYVAWSKITRPVELGGLGIRDLNKMNEALMMKLLWKIASDNPALWVDVVRAKYIPRSELWVAKRNYNCTPCWKAIMAARERLLPMLMWRLGDGRTCRAMVQPWFEGAVNCLIQNSEHKMLSVRDLVLEGTGTWDANLLIQLYGHVNCMSIMGNVRPPLDEAGADSLIFTESSNGRFSVKYAYKGITQEGLGQQQGSEVWKLIWRKGNILPRIRVFLWKLLHGALPLAKILCTRTSRGDPMCAVCNQGEEDVLHMLFHCPFARACWLMGPLALRTDELPRDLSIILDSLFKHKTDEVWTMLANSAWAIWRCRNEKTYGGNVPTFERFLSILNSVGVETRVAAAANKKKEVQLEVSNACNSQYRCKVDGSWRSPWIGGLGFVVEDGELLKGYRAAPSVVCSPMQAEAVALREAIHFVKSLNLPSCTFLTDNQDLANVCMELHPPIDADWRAYREINEVWRLLKEFDYECRHIPRSQNCVADHLAKVGSRLSEGFTGYSYPTFKIC